MPQRSSNRPGKGKGNQDRLWVMFWLLMMPMATAGQLVMATGFHYSKVNRILKALRSGGLVVNGSLVGTDGLAERWLLSGAAVLLVAREYKVPIPWQATEDGIATLIKRGRIVSLAYDLALGFWEHPGVRTDRAAHWIPGTSLGPQDISINRELMKFEMFKDGGVDAVAEFANGAWVAMVLVGSEETPSLLRERAEKAWRAPVATLHEGTGRQLTPAGWVIVGADLATAMQAGELWPDDNTLVVLASGHMKREMQVSDFSLRVFNSPGFSDPGRPEQIVRWAQNNPVLQALNSPLACAVFWTIAEWRGVTPAQLKKAFGASYSAVVRSLRRSRLIAKMDGGFYLTRRGVKAAAEMDGVDFDTVWSRWEKVLKRDGKYRRQQMKHDRKLFDIVLKLEQEGIPAFAGYRFLLNFPDVTQVVPDAVLYVEPEDGQPVWVFLELEFTAKEPGRRKKKLRPYWRADAHSLNRILSVWLFEDERVRRRYAAEGKGLRMLTATLDQFLAGSSWGPDSVWRLGDLTVPIDHLAKMVDEDLDGKDGPGDPESSRP